MHGVSMITFMKLVRGEDVTMVVCEDEQGHKFGALNFEEWQHRKQFYGTGESFVFTFHDED